MFDTSGQFLRGFGKRGGLGVCEFERPDGIAIDRANNVYICNCINHRIQVFTPDGTHITTFGQNGNQPGLFSFVEGIFIDQLGRIYVGDQNARVNVFGFVL